MSGYETYGLAVENGLGLLATEKREKHDKDRKWAMPVL